MAARKFPRPPKGHTAWSYSQISDWACPLHGHLRRDEQRRDLPSPALYKGRIAHDVIAAYCQHLLATGQEADPGAIDAIARDVYFAADGAEAHGLGIEAWPEILDLARRFAERWSMPLQTLFSQEEVWLVHLFGTHHMWVIADLVTAEGDTAVIRDFKTDWHLRTEAEVEEDPQLPIYAWAVAKQWPHFRRFRCCLDFVRHGRERWVEYDLEDVRAVDEALRAEVARILAVRESGSYPAAPGRTCRYCPFTARCPAVQKAPELVRITTAEEATEAAGSLLALERRREILREALAAWTSEAGPVEVGGIEWGHLLSEGVAVPTDRTPEFAEALRAAGLDPWEYLRVDTTKLRALMRRPELAAVVQDLVVDSSSTSFRSRKAQPRREAVAG